MSKSNNRHVVPNSGRNGWDVVAPGAQRVSSHHATQAEAQAAARRIVHNVGGGEVVTHRPNGQIPAMNCGEAQEHRRGGDRARRSRTRAGRS